MKKTYEIIKNAREIVKARWLKGKMGNTGGPRCAVGAIYEAAGYDFALPATEEKAQKLQLACKVENLLNDVVVAANIERPNPPPYAPVPAKFSSIMGYNDHVDTKQEDVVKMFNVALRKSR